MYIEKNIAYATQAMQDVVIDRCCDLSIILLQVEKYTSSSNAKRENVANSFQFISKHYKSTVC